MGSPEVLYVYRDYSGAHLEDPTATLQRTGMASSIRYTQPLGGDWHTEECILGRWLGNRAIGEILGAQADLGDNTITPDQYVSRIVGIVQRG